MEDTSSLGRTGKGVTLYIVSDQLECKELCLGMDEEHTESLWVRTKWMAGQVTQTT